MISKRCGKCGLTKPIEEFYLRRTGDKAGQYYEKCRTCMKLRGREYYHKNRERQLHLALVRRAKAYKLKRNLINKVKDRPCADCGIKYPFYVMDFDHRDHKDKINDIALMTRRNWSLKKIEVEVQKCDIVCANCHRIRTFSNVG